MNSNQEWKSRKDAATPRGVGVMCNFYAERAENSELWDIEGNEVIDFAAGSGLVGLVVGAALIPLTSFILAPAWRGLARLRPRRT